MRAKLENFSRVISDIFEDMFFLFHDEPIPDHRPGNRSWYRICIAVIGPDPFSLHFSFSDKLARIMAENYLGLDSADISQDIAVDVIKEAVNVMAGNLLNQMNDESVLGIPEYQGVRHQLDPFDTETTLDLHVEGEWLRVSMQTRT